MDFLDPKKRRAHKIKLYIGYGLMAVALGIATLIMYWRSYGYDIDRKTGEVIQKGLIFVDAHPVSADISLNGQNMGRTSQRLNVAEGDYELVLSQKGYRSWTRKFHLDGNSIERFAYPFLFPEKLEISDLLTYQQQPGLITGSPDRRWLLVQHPGSMNNFDLIDLLADKPEAKVISIPSAVLKSGVTEQKFELVEWSTDNKHLIVKHVFNGGYEFVLINTESAQTSINLSTTFKTPFTDISLRDKKYDQYLIHDSANNSLRRIDLKTLSPTLLAENVASYKSHGDDLLIYATAIPSATGKIEIRFKMGSEDYLLRNVDPSAKYLIDAARFENAWYLVAGSRIEKKVYVYKNPQDKIKNSAGELPSASAVLTTANEPLQASFSANARFVAVTTNNQIAVYDAETKRHHKYYPDSAEAVFDKFEWMDGHRLVSVFKDKTLVFDFNGINKQELSPAIAGSRVLFDRDYEAMYNLTRSQTDPAQFVISRTELRVED